MPHKLLHTNDSALSARVQRSAPRMLIGRGRRSTHQLGERIDAVGARRRRRSLRSRHGMSGALATHHKKKGDAMASRKVPVNDLAPFAGGAAAARRVMMQGQAA
jgi:hypothetical protein